ncbi:hypothetical protein [Lacinutrix sp. Bg11-31]|uniref:hypothetical protein n=1 Tax=Lacinutrix sp. Bg11-31 TaxID=2057808 RepID=UPI000C3107FF|nr:hypothetical protein [Lacinutrix sp. Bg11-31]AUC80905.1 hypothetical protein CW733_01650 [Lacinutrix sp. Bg11-31]
MELIQNNPYRIAGILSNATAKELEKQRGKIRAFAKVGKKINSEYDFQDLNSITRTEDSINKAFSNIEQNQDKVNYALFWFLNVNPFDNTAIDYLKNGDKEKAIEIWDKVTQNKDVNSKNFSAFNNLGTFKLLSKNQDEIKKGIEAKIKLIESGYFENFVHSVADETFTIDNKKQIEKLVDELLTQFKNQYSSSETLQLFSNCNGSTRNYLSKKFTEEPLHNIESQISRSKNKRKDNKIDAYQFGLNLAANCKDDLVTLQSLLGITDLKYKTIADQLANEIMQCGIDYFNESQENDSNKDYLKQAQELNKTALSIAVGSLIQDRAKDHISTLEEMKDNSLSQAVELLQSVKDAYETNEAKIRQQIKDLMENDAEIKFGLKTINQTAVDDNIKNSINWKEVNNLLNAVLDSSSLGKIKESSNNKLKAEFIELAKWLKENSSSNSVITRIINDYKKIPPKLTFKVTSSEITNTDNQPLYIKFVRYIGLNLNIKVENPTSVNFYLKYINPDGSIKRNSKISPIGYSQSTTKEINNDSKTIELPGWGNSDECTYKIGEHRIEVYVDEYLIHSKKYVVELAPSERLQKEISSAEKKLRQINQTNYLENEIRFARNEMSEIQKFKLFRGSSEKQEQIQSQQKKIDQLTEKSKIEKRRNIKSQEEKIYKLKMELSAAKY